MSTTVGVVGLGIMGGAMAANLLKNGFDVVGRDPVPEMVERFEAAGGTHADSPKAVAEAADIVITSLPSVAAFHDVMEGADGLAAAAKSGQPVMETSTLPISDKQRGHDALAAAGLHLLDCPLSGTGQQAQTGDLTVFISGDKGAADRCVPVIEGFSRGHDYVGDFGNGSRMKFVANHLINVLNVACAEAMTLGIKGGLDPDMIFDVIQNSAANSRMWEIRGKMMAADDYDNVGMKIDVWQKDLKVIGEYAAEIHCPMPLFHAAAQPYFTAMETGLGMKDTAAVCRVLEGQAGAKRG